MKLIEVSDFENQEMSIDDLWKKQKAKCHELDVYIMQLAKQYPDWWKVRGQTWTGRGNQTPTEDWENCTTTQLGPVSSWTGFLPLVDPPVRSKITNRFCSKYNQLIKAKEEFEATDSDYESYRKK